MDRRRTRCRHAAWTLALVAAVGAMAAAPPQTGDCLPELRLAVPRAPEHRSYLGLTGQGEFTLHRIKAEVLIVEIFSMYCPHCQKEAPRVNALYHRIESQDRFRGRIKLIGIGVGNSDYEVSVFRETFAIPFPLFADGNYHIHKRLGEVRTPYFLVARPGSDGAWRLIYSAAGALEDLDAFLERMLVLAAPSNGGGS
jgi:thiol-disulfide isomerase/thioredoxin